MQYPKQLTLALPIILLCFNITPVTGELISFSHHTMSSAFLSYIDHPLFAGLAWCLAAGILYMIIHSRAYADHTVDH